MKTFEYSAVSRDGLSVSGCAFAESEHALDSELEGRGLVLTRASQRSERDRSRGGKLSNADLINLTHQLSTVTGAGVRVVEGLISIGQRLEKKPSRDVVERIVASLRHGNSLSEALDLESGSFPAVFRASVRAGEASGALDKVLLRLARHRAGCAGSAPRRCRP